MSRLNNYAFIDGTNLHLTYEYLGWKINYQKLRNYLTKKLDITVAYYFLGNTIASEPICQNLDSYGYTIKKKEPTYFSDEEKYCPYCLGMISPELPRHKSDCDSFMTMDVMENLTSFNQAVIITSDGDFDNLVTKLYHQNKLKLVFAPCRDGCSNLLIKAANRKIAFIDDFRNELEKI
jgi:uncharacterized LabA/DUF88 family protein